MVRRLQFILLAGSAGFLISCGNESSESASATPAPQQGFQQKSGDLFDDDSDKMINRYAKTNPLMQKGGEQAAKEGVNRDNRYFEGELAKREFEAKDYTKKSFWGTKDYAKQVYEGPTDGSRFMKGSSFNTQGGARENTMVSPDSGSAFATGRHKTGAARENETSNISKTSDANTDSRRKVFVQPEITDWRDQRGLTIDDTRSMLGRGN
jgi:hypothetical protein